jgi:molybdenum cofactor synthesis domain-containing protein
VAETAALLIIGNEVLTGKVKDENIATIAGELFALGVALRRVVVCEDDVPTIARDLNALRAAHDVVITTGGVGPTHDDLTYEAVAAAFGVAIERSGDIEGMIRGRFKERTNDGHLRMADIPAGAELLRTEEVRWPIIKIGNVFVLPGVPDIVRARFPMLREHLRAAKALLTRAIFTTCDEFDMADKLTAVQARFPDVRIGSYPRWDDPSYKVKLTFDGTDQGAIDSAVEAFFAAVPADWIAKR